MTASHLLFVPRIAITAPAIIEDHSKGQSTRDLERWLAVHRVRTWTVDLAAWGVYHNCHVELRIIVVNMYAFASLGLLYIGIITLPCADF